MKICKKLKKGVLQSGWNELINAKEDKLQRQIINKMVQPSPS